MPWASDEQINKILSQVSGVVLQGGSMKFNPEESLYTQTAFKIFDYAGKNPNFVVFGVCNGFQTINRWVKPKILYQNSGKKTMEGVLMPAQIVKNKSRLLKNFSHKQLEDFSKKSTANFHLFSIKTGIKGKWANYFESVLEASNPIDENEKFVAAVEAKNHEIYGVQFHPEKMLNDYYNSSKNKQQLVGDFQVGREIAVKLAEFIVERAKLNKRCMSDEVFEKKKGFPNMKNVLDKQNKINENHSSEESVNEVKKSKLSILSCGSYPHTWYNNPEYPQDSFKCPPEKKH